MPGPLCGARDLGKVPEGGTEGDVRGVVCLPPSVSVQHLESKGTLTLYFPSGSPALRPLPGKEQAQDQ